jgi:hypothetical protein
MALFLTRSCACQQQQQQQRLLMEAGLPWAQA